MAVPDQDIVTLLIANQEFAAWPSIDIITNLDAISAVEFNAPFESDRADFRELFRPFQFKPVEVRIRPGDDQEAGATGGLLAAAVGAVAAVSGLVGGVDPLIGDVDPTTVFKGTMLNIDPDSSPNRSAVSVTAYSTPGVLQDCTAPTTSLPVEFAGLKLDVIAKTIADAFGFEVAFAEDPGAAFNKVKLDIEQKQFDFLANLARQRNLVVSSTKSGDLLFQRSIATGNPVARLELGQQPLLNVTANFSPQDYFSEMTAFVSARKKRKGTKARKGSIFKVDNPKLSVLRPLNFKVPDTEEAGAPEAANAKLARMFGNVASYQVDLATWRDPQGDLWTPNTTITLNAPDAMIYSEFEFLIRSVQLHQDAENQNASLNVVLPGSFSGEIPDILPWED